MTYHIDDTPLVQFPIRLSKDLHTRFTRVSQETRINKSKLLRIALDRLVTQIQNQGITAVLSETGVKG
jgi:predicted DNA-binding protein